jgi:hypothetical protein
MNTTKEIYEGKEVTVTHLGQDVTVTLGHESAMDIYKLEWDGNSVTQHWPQWCAREKLVPSVLMYAKNMKETNE